MRSIGFIFLIAFNAEETGDRRQETGFIVNIDRAIVTVIIFLLRKRLCLSYVDYTIVNTEELLVVPDKCK